MPRIRTTILGLLVLCAPLVAQEPARSDWMQWRGPLATGYAENAQPPLEWSETKNVRWKVPLPGLGHSTPAVAGERIYLTTAIPTGDRFEPRRPNVPGAHDNLAVTQAQDFVLLALNAQDGSTAWQRTLRSAIPHEGGHVSASLASASPVTNGELVFAFFGSYGLYCVDAAGDVLWTKDFGPMQTKHAHGEGASPVLFEDKLALCWDHEGQSFVVVLDAQTGEEIWRHQRDEPTSWATPIVVPVGDQDQLIVSGTKRLRGYDLADGKVVWVCGGLSHNIVASPVTYDGIVFAGSSYEKQALLAIRLAGARGNLERSEQLLWMRRARTPYVPSPLVFDDTLYFLSHYQGPLSRVDVHSGKDRGRPISLRETGIRNVYASPVAAGDRIYLTDLEGTTCVLAHPSGEVLATNWLDDSFAASAALVGPALYLRGERSLYRIQAPE